MKSVNKEVGSSSKKAEKQSKKSIIMKRDTFLQKWVENPTTENDKRF